ncbi:hypothetical protein QBC46DRAFT_343702 [Diplogelasinospora grovesii]|uniref:Uncharacterized protein n=1 Tax=Diplogelasinospora grovesii TaxID=303347 RepID=A0AAN6N345_9PEZI|nr:hypothetical protein QBC46DRAFT_343702 [Diplogelasinospora grovesii]
MSTHGLPWVGISRPYPEAGVIDKGIDLGRPWWMHWSRYLFALTDTSLMGWVAAGTCPGDAVCLFRGCDVPFVLRKNEETTKGNFHATTSSAIEAEDGDETFWLYGDGYFQGLEPTAENSDTMRWFTLV